MRMGGQHDEERDPGRPCRRRGHRGMTLIEIMMVMGIFVLMLGMVVFGMRTSQTADAIRAVHQVSNAIRYGFDKARVSGSNYRLLINLDQGSFTLQAASERMYLPATDRDGKILEIDEGKVEERADRDRRAEESYNRSLQAQLFGGAGEASSAASNDPYRASARRVPRRRPPVFEGFKEENALSGLTDAIQLPEGVKIVYARTADDLLPITSGEMSLYFFPRGQTQLAHILVQDESGDAKWTIKVAPLTGRVTVAEGHHELELPETILEGRDDLGKRGERRTF